MKINDIIKKPVGNLTLCDVYQLAELGYIFIKKNNTIIIGKAN
jgi:hypothetical protein